MDPSTGIHNPLNQRPARPAGLNDILEDLIHQVFMKDPDVAVENKIIFKRLQFQAGLIRTVLDLDGGEIRQPRLRADAGEFREIQVDHVIAVLIFVVPDLDRRCF